MALLDYVERLFAWFCINVKGHDSILFTRRHGLFGLHTKPTIHITSPLDPPSTSTSNSDNQQSAPSTPTSLPIEYSAVGSDLFPPLTWSGNLPTGTVEQILIVEDPDAPLWFAPTHGFYYHIPPSLTSLESSDFANIANPGYKAKGISLGLNFHKTVYSGPRPILNHGPHRYFFQLIALGRKLEGVKDEGASLEEVFKALRAEDVLGWGEWVGVFERKA